MKVKIIDIANKAGVSTGTVDRVLHKRGNVSAQSQKLVEDALSELNYEPNVLASFLASKRSFNFAAVVPSYSKGSYWELVCKGITRAHHEVEKFNTRIDMLTFDQYDPASFNEVSKTIFTENYDGVIMATLFEEPAIALSEKLDALEIPYIYIDSDIPGQNNIAYFGSNTFVSGRIAARLLLESTTNMTTIFFAHVKFKQSTISVQMKNREKGFMSYLKENNYSGKIEHIEIDPDNYKIGLKILEELLETSHYPVGGIVLNSRFYELNKVLRELPQHLRKKLLMLGHDAIAGNVDALKRGEIKLLLSQRTDLQGYDAVKALSNHVIFKESPQKTNYMPIDILLAENIDYYYYYHHSDTDKN